MTFDRDGHPLDARDRVLAPDDRFEEALRAFAAADDETSSDDVEASNFLDRFPVAARERRRPDEG
ncbi:hypothetical protein [Chenggangzhangella methanolivorans]|uniref:Uncharacterized protein n=1 Tax=Chenggangzhangella methanolivorans TaxID=1437009 RepID=A0A9E6UGX6_9HYPH|nr:hypothetical protein [Chenggangzhangella methanolivorans]QZN99192.1 hypothetical protein K6K41_20550 [Chenggangzhangella methanolivorans]